MIRQLLRTRVPSSSISQNVRHSASLSIFSPSCSMILEQYTRMGHQQQRRMNTVSEEKDPSTQSVRLTIEEVRSTTTQALRKLGWDTNSASIQADIMTAAEISGNNQGLVKMMQPAFMSPSMDASEPTIERETTTSAIINGNQCPGMIVASLAAELATSKVLQSMDGSSSKIDNYQLHTRRNTSPSDIPVIAVVGTYNTCTSSGQLGHYVKKMAEEGVIGIALVNSPEYVAAAPGAKPSLGTNPIAVGIPSIDSPFVFDMATSAIALFGVMLAHAKSQPLPSQVAYGKDGYWTTNPVEALPGGGGAIATFGGHKGMGLSVCVELLSGVLSGGAVLGQVESKKVAKSNGHLFIAIRPNGLVDNFEEKVASVIKYIKESGENVRIPGEKSSQTAQARLKEGYISIPVKVWDQIVQLATK